MRVGTGQHWFCVGLLAAICQVSTAEESSAPPAPTVSVKRDCADAKGATKKECEKVAAKIDAQAADPAAAANEEPHATADYVHHSSPAVRTPAEVAQDKKAKREDKRESTPPKPKTPAPK
jgi:hypothetical protein